MPRAVAVYRELWCHNCDRRWHQHVWGYDANWTRPRQSLTCTCSTPHIEVLPQWHQRSRAAQVRAEQRCAVYLMPDGSLSVPPTNKYDDPVALEAVAQGAVRTEAYHLSDLRRWHEERRLSREQIAELGYVDEYGRLTVDDFTDRSLVLDYDQARILSGDTHLRMRLQQEDEGRRQVYDRQLRGEVFYGGEVYEERKRRMGRG